MKFSKNFFVLPGQNLPVFGSKFAIRGLLRRLPVICRDCLSVRYRPPGTTVITMPANCRKTIKWKSRQQAEAKFLYKDRYGRHNLCEILSTSYPHPATCGKKRKIIRANKLLKHNLILKIGVKMIKYPGINRILSVCYYIITLLLRTIPNFWDFAQNTFRAGRGISQPAPP